VLGHSKCGAVKGACDNVKMGSLTGLLNKIQPAVEAEESVIENRNSGNDEFVEKVNVINEHTAVEAIMERSPILRKLIEEGECGIVAGNHDISTGEVTFHQDTKMGFFKPVPEIFSDGYGDIVIPNDL